MSIKRDVVDIIPGYIGVMLMTFLLIQFNHNVLPSIPLIVRMVLMIVMYWLIALAPIIIMIIRKDKINEFGFTKEKAGKQILTGVILGITFSIMFTLLPHLIGFGDFVSSESGYKYIWQFSYEFVYSILAVGLTEEFIFRGYFYRKIERISSTTVAIFLSSVMFGFFHIFNGNLIQVIVTSLLGIIFCLCKNKMKYASTLSLGIAHGIYDALIVVLSIVF